LPARRFEQAIKAALADAGRNSALLEECLRQAECETEEALKSPRARRTALGAGIRRVTQETGRLISAQVPIQGPRDLKQECLKLDERKRQLKTEIHNLNIETNRKAQQVADRDTIRGSLLDFAA